MRGASRRNHRTPWLSALATLSAAAFVLFGTQNWIASSPETGLSRTGQAQLISVEPYPVMSGAVCEWEPASSGQTLMAVLQQRQANREVSAARRTIERGDLKPIRMIRDDYAAYSSVAVDPIRNEVVLTDENLFQILVYDREANTPPTATMTEPKRILGGHNTKIEFQCGLYIDPESGDIFAVNNDTVDTLVIFDRDARGDVPPTRELYTPHGTFGIAVDEQAREMFLTVQHDSAVSVFPKDAVKDDEPLRLLQGDNTMLADPHGIALDPKRGLMFVANHGAVHKVRAPYEGYVARNGEGKDNWPLDRNAAVPGSGESRPPSVTVYDIKANGDAAPLRIIQGPKTTFNWPTGLAVNPETGELYVSNDMDDSILVFDGTASGDVAPKRKLSGPKTYLSNPTGIWLDMDNEELWAANFGNHSATVYPIDASGDVAPLRMIRSGPLDKPALGIGNPHPVAYDSKREQILVPN